MFGICVEQPPDHPLVLGVSFARLVLEEVDATLAQRDRVLHAFFPEDQILGTRQEVRSRPAGYEAVPRLRFHP